jgi:hypothetical protein
MAKGKQACVAQDNVVADGQDRIVKEDIERRHPDKGRDVQGSAQP